MGRQERRDIRKHERNVHHVDLAVRRMKRTRPNNYPMTLSYHTRKSTLLFAAALLAGSVGCKRDDDDPITPAPPVNEEEVITTVRLNFVSAGNVENKTFAFVDADGDGGGAPVITADTLSLDSVYTVRVEILNESVTPAIDISEEVAEEGAAHQFFFQASGIGPSIAYADLDVNGLPIGLLSTWTVSSAGSGAVTVTLRHELDKSAAGVSSGDITNAGGETDIEVVFPLVVD